jgi:hypothetical protein
MTTVYTRVGLEHPLGAAVLYLFLQMSVNMNEIYAPPQNQRFLRTVV